MNTDLYHGDSCLVLSDLYDKGVRVDLTVTSPPYDNLRSYKDSCVWNFDVFKGIAEQIVKITKQGGGNCLGSIRRSREWQRKRHILQTSIIF